MSEAADCGCDQKTIADVAEDPMALRQRRDGVIQAALPDRDAGELAERHALDRFVVCRTRLTKVVLEQRSGLFEVAVLVERPGEGSVARRA